ncbi:MAG: sugar porter family MFS transporter [Pirellulaceae bacterium]|nr:sugar porter family MFS transporter [Pirellulaceae bacterium]
MVEQESMERHNPISREGASLPYLVLVVSVATVGGFLFGYDTLIFTGAGIFLRDSFQLSPDELGQAGASVVIGCLFGTWIAALVSDWIGRKKTMIFAALLFAVSAVMTAIPPDIHVFNMFRAVGGVGVGIAMVISPVYIAEISPKRIRGGLVTLNQIVIVTGALIAAIVGWQMGQHLAPDVSWRWMFASECIPILGFAAGLLLIPESPRFLMQKQLEDQARDVLTRINGAQVATRELNEIRASIELEKTQSAVSYRELLHPGVRMAMIIAIGLAALQQLSGGMPLNVYAPIILQDAGFADPNDAIFVPVLMFSCSLVCVFIVLYLVERVGRRPILLWGVSAMAVGHLVLAYCFHKPVEGAPIAIALILTAGMSNLSISPLAWVIMAEIFPTRIRGRAMGIATFVLYLSMYLTSRYFPPIQEYSESTYGSPAVMFVALAAICVFGVIFMYVMVPETKGKSLEEIANHWLEKR